MANIGCHLRDRDEHVLPSPSLASSSVLIIPGMQSVTSHSSLVPYSDAGRSFCFQESPKSAEANPIPGKLGPTY